MTHIALVLLVKLQPSKRAQARTNEAFKYQQAQVFLGLLQQPLEVNASTANNGNNNRPTNCSAKGDSHP